MEWTVDLVHGVVCGPMGWSVDLVHGVVHGPGPWNSLWIWSIGWTVGLGPVVQSPISTNPGLTLNKTYRVNPGLALIGL